MWNHIICFISAVSNVSIREKTDHSIFAMKNKFQKALLHEEVVKRTQPKRYKIKAYGVILTIPEKKSMLLDVCCLYGMRICFLIVI